MKLIIFLIAIVGTASVSGDCNCGWTNSGRIVGGKESPKNAYPLMVAVVDEYAEQFCGGTIITHRHVLTAAHCTIDKTPWSIWLRVGIHDLRSRVGAVYDVSRIINHERFNLRKLEFDIALVVTKITINFDQNIGPACLPPARLSLTGRHLRALGWGNVQDLGESSNVLREVDLKVIPFDRCYYWWGNRIERPIEANNVCTHASKKDSCQGDSGGPLIWLNPTTRRFTLAALVSYGGVCGGEFPAVNTDVSAFLPWINENIAASVPEVAACIKG